MAVAAAKPAEDQESKLSFIPVGMPRSIAEYFAAMIPGAILLFAFFLAAEAAMMFLGGSNGGILSIAFLPVICIMPILSGVVSTLILEKLRKKPLTIQRGATIGAFAALCGATLSALMLGLIQLFTHKAVFGISAISGLILVVVLLIVIVIDAILGALGGALVVKFIKDI
ncbi:MAG: hypothetical protein NTV88_04110 [Candidatus Micrarchaeota archaeon]|nr:hypothetical protein [Candidatus Micrarchaeota archaeon]